MNEYLETAEHRKQINMQTYRLKVFLLIKLFTFQKNKVIDKSTLVLKIITFITAI